jgi:two-component system cell cycle response regulator DivK
MRFEEADHRRQKLRIGGVFPQLFRPDSGQVEEPLRPAGIAERCRKCGEGKSYRIVWCLGEHSLEARKGAGGASLAKILIVEDNALNIKLFCDLLAAHGHQPEAVTDSRNALEAARSFEPDLVITDIQLPHVSGLELIHLIREDSKLSKTPIMAVTAYSARGDEERIREAGAQAYVSKPISVVRFAQAVDELLAQSAAVAVPVVAEGAANESEGGLRRPEARAEEE